MFIIGSRFTGLYTRHMAVNRAPIYRSNKNLKYLKKGKTVKQVEYNSVLFCSDNIQTLIFVVLAQFCPIVFRKFNDDKVNQTCAD